jgi:hypothetical protein
MRTARDCDPDQQDWDACFIAIGGFGTLPEALAERRMLNVEYSVLNGLCSGLIQH